VFVTETPQFNEYRGIFLAFCNKSAVLNENVVVFDSGFSTPFWQVRHLNTAKYLVIWRVYRKPPLKDDLNQNIQFRNFLAFFAK